MVTIKDITDRKAEGEKGKTIIVKKFLIS